MMDPKRASKKKLGQALECEMMDPKQASKNLIPQALVEVPGVQTSYRSLKVGRGHFGAVHTLKGEMQSLK